MAIALGLLIGLAVIGFVAWLLVSFVPMPERYKPVFVGAAVLILAILVLMWAFGRSGVIWPQ